MDDRVRVYHLTELKNRRRDLRQKSTMAEKLLWEELRNSKLGVKFRRQFSVKGYVLDFYCSKMRLGVELVGGIHKKAEIKKYDVFRKAYIEAFDIKVLEISNEEVESNMKGVVERIRNFFLTLNLSP